MSKKAPNVSTKQAIELIRGLKPYDRLKGHLFTHDNQPLSKDTGEFGFENNNPYHRYEATLFRITYYDPILDEHQLTQVFLARIHQTWGNSITWGIGFFIPLAETLIILKYDILSKHLNKSG